GQLVVAGGDGAVALEVGDAAFDRVAQLVLFGIEGGRRPPARPLFLRSQRFPGRWVIAARRRWWIRSRPTAANPPGAAAWPQVAQPYAGTEPSRRPCAGERAGSSTGGGLPGARAFAAAEGVGVGGGELPGAGEEVVDDGELIVGVGGQQFAGL